jgi:DNA polymerase I
VTQRCYNGVRLLGCRVGPSPRNIYKVDGGALHMIHRMAQCGLVVDLNHFAKLDVELTRDMDRVTEDVHQLTGHYLNLGSGDQVADLLFKKMGLKQAKIKMTTSGERESVEDEVLTAIQHEHPVVGKCLEYKEYEKLRGTYVRPMPKLARRTGSGEWRMYPNFRTTRVPSGRLSCSDPNLLAMPSRTERGRDIRKGFPARKGCKKVSIDESQIEVRIAAHRSGDVNLCNIYHTQQDIYSDFATAAFRLEDKRNKDENGKWQYPTVDKAVHRFPAKTCVLASIYDVTGGGLQEQMPVVCANCNKPAICPLCQNGKDHSTHIQHDCPRFFPMWTEKKCDDLIQSFYLRYPGLMRMRVDDHNYMRKHAFMVDDWGRLMHVQAVRSILPWVVTSTLREGANFPIQSMAQGTVKVTMAAVDDDLEASKLYRDGLVEPNLQIHDELLMDVREDLADEVGELIKYRFETCVALIVPIKAGAVQADTWGDLEK